MMRKMKVEDLPIELKVKEVLLKVLGPGEEVYVEQVGGRVRIII